MSQIKSGESARPINNPARSMRSGFVATAEDFVALRVLQDHFQAASVLYFRCRHALHVLLRGLHGGRQQVPPYQRIPRPTANGDDVVNE